LIRALLLRQVSVLCSQTTYSTRYHNGFNI
jgi:hypothetical protein